MNRDEFQRALHKGFGRAILFARDHDVSEFRDVIVDACLHQYAFDPQTEGTRGWYMHKFVKTLPDSQFYLDRVFDALSSGGDDWDARHRFELASRVAAEGDELVRRALYENFEPGPVSGEHIGAEFLKLDGMPGFLFAADKIGGLILNRPDELEQGWLIGEAVDACGEEQVWKALEEAAEENWRIKAYYLAAKQAEWEQLPNKDYELRKREILSLTYEQLKNNVARTNLGFFRIWGEQASPEELLNAAHGLIAAKTLEDQTAHLVIFERTPFPLDLKTLTALAFVSEGRVGFYAVKALSIIEHAAVREVAFELIRKESAARGSAVRLLNKNFSSEDYATVLGWFEQEQDQNAKHRLGTDLLAFFGTHPQEESEIRMLYSIYENGPCSHCRYSAVRRLIELDSLTPAIRAECEFDANEDTRELVNSGSVGVGK